MLRCQGLEWSCTMRELPSPARVALDEWLRLRPLPVQTDFVEGSNDAYGAWDDLMARLAQAHREAEEAAEARAALSMRRTAKAEPSRPPPPPNPVQPDLLPPARERGGEAERWRYERRAPPAHAREAYRAIRGALQGACSVDLPPEEDGWRPVVLRETAARTVVPVAEYHHASGLTLSATEARRPPPRPRSGRSPEPRAALRQDGGEQRDARAAHGCPFLPRADRLASALVAFAGTTIAGDLAFAASPDSTLGRWQRFCNHLDHCVTS
eukprot:tig00020614_g12122.t1